MPYAFRHAINSWRRRAKSVDEISIQGGSLEQQGADRESGLSRESETADAI